MADDADGKHYRFPVLLTIFSATILFGSALVVDLNQGFSSKSSLMEVSRLACERIRSAHIDDFPGDIDFSQRLALAKQYFIRMIHNPAISNSALDADTHVSIHREAQNFTILSRSTFNTQFLWMIGVTKFDVDTSLVCETRQKRIDNRPISVRRSSVSGWAFLTDADQARSQDEYQQQWRRQAAGAGQSSEMISK